LDCFPHDPSQIPQIGGYVADVPYVRNFIRHTAPAWLDHVALVSGFAPPERDSGFAWCDLGCGQGVTAAILAATHPKASFHGIDAMPVHIDSARRFASEAGIPNVSFHAADFGSGSVSNPSALADLKHSLALRCDHAS